MSTEQDVLNVTEIVLFADYKQNAVEKESFEFVGKLDGCVKCVTQM